MNRSQPVLRLIEYTHTHTTVEQHVITQHGHNTFPLSLSRGVSKRSSLNLLWSGKKREMFFLFPKLPNRVGRFYIIDCDSWRGCVGLGDDLQVQLCADRGTVLLRMRATPQLTSLDTSRWSQIFGGPIRSSNSIVTSYTTRHVTGSICPLSIHTSTFNFGRWMCEWKGDKGSEQKQTESEKGTTPPPTLFSLLCPYESVVHSRWLSYLICKTWKGLWSCFDDSTGGLDPACTQHSDHHSAICEYTVSSRREYPQTLLFLDPVTFPKQTVLEILGVRWDHKHVRFREHNSVNSGKSIRETIASAFSHQE